jgi:hypothetical protein
MTNETIRKRVERVLEALRGEDLEERVAPVKCNKHPEHPDCMSDYGVIWYGGPEYGTPDPDYGVPPED